MSDSIENSDPRWALAPWRPDTGQPWTRKLAAHVYRRCAFGATSAMLDEAVKIGPEATLERLFNAPPLPPAMEETFDVLSSRVAAAGNEQQLGPWWLFRILNTPDPLAEKLTLFWHGHFATSVQKVGKIDLMLDQNAMLRRLGGGKFADLVRAVSRDAAMLIYLDSTTNRRIHPNENYARELMELFSLGVGHYTETDVKELARAFTGREVIGDRFVFNAAQHDTGAKTLIGRTGAFDGDQAIAVILDQPAAARFIATKLIRFFALDEPAPGEALVDALAQSLIQNEFAIKPMLRTLAGSNFFFSPACVGKKVRSPVEVGMSLLKCLGGTSNLLALNQGLTDLGQGLFFPPNVKGWDGGRAWINSATMLGRANLVSRTLLAAETSFTRDASSLAEEADRAGAASPEQLVDWLLELLVAVPISRPARNALTTLAADALTASDRNGQIIAVLRAIGALPEFQLA